MSSEELEARELAGDLAGEQISSLERVPGSGNSRIYRVLGNSGRAYALKIYARDGRLRMEREVEALAFLGRSGCGVVARLAATAPEGDAALFEWLEGGPAEPHRPEDIAQLCAFFAELHRLRAAPGAEELRPGREAVTSSGDLESQLRERLTRLKGAAAGRAELGDVLGEIQTEISRRTLRTMPELPRERQTLSPSDAGFHNAIRRPDGRLAFVDFEYFGWDDPVKLVSDVLWHPGHRLREDEAVEFRSRAAEIYSVDPAYEVRFDAFYPFFGLRWALIALNEFFPKEKARREFAGATGVPENIEELQLAKARDMVQRVRALPI